MQRVGECQRKVDESGWLGKGNIFFCSGWGLPKEQTIILSEFRASSEMPQDVELRLGFANMCWFHFSFLFFFPFFSFFLLSLFSPFLLLYSFPWSLFML